VLALIECVEDDDRDQRRRTVRNTIEHFKNGDRVMGWKTLSQWLDDSVLSSIKKWLSAQLRIAEEPMPSEKSAPVSTIPAFDKKLLEVPGLVGDIAQWAGRRAYLQQPAFDLAAGLMSTALAASNKYVVDSWDTPLQPYF